jgi:hypothetical protein
MKIIENSKEKAVIARDHRDEQWCDCSDESLQKILGRTEKIERVKFEDRTFLASHLNIYFEPSHQSQ